MAKPQKQSQPAVAKQKKTAKQKKLKETGQGKRGRQAKGKCLEDRPLLEPNAAGIDIGAREIFVP